MLHYAKTMTSFSSDTPGPKRDYHLDQIILDYSIIGISMAVSCGQCGYCCSFMSDVFGIIEQIDTYQYRIQYLPTGIQQVVTVDPDKETLFSGSTILDKRPLACPFLREQSKSQIICTVYQTRPELCRIYLCDRQKEQTSG